MDQEELAATPSGRPLARRLVLVALGLLVLAGPLLAGCTSAPPAAPWIPSDDMSCQVADPEAAAGAFRLTSFAQGPAWHPQLVVRASNPCAVAIPLASCQEPGWEGWFRGQLTGPGLPGLPGPEDAVGDSCPSTILLPPASTWEGFQDIDPEIHDSSGVRDVLHGRATAPLTPGAYEWRATLSVVLPKSEARPLSTSVSFAVAPPPGSDGPTAPRPSGGGPRASPQPTPESHPAACVGEGPRPPRAEGATRSIWLNYSLDVRYEEVANFTGIRAWLANGCTNATLIAQMWPGLHDNLWLAGQVVGAGGEGTLIHSLQTQCACLRWIAAGQQRMEEHPLQLAPGNYTLSAHVEFVESPARGAPNPELGVTLPFTVHKGTGPSTANR